MLLDKYVLFECIINVKILVLIKKNKDIVVQHVELEGKGKE